MLMQIRQPHDEKTVYSGAVCVYLGGKRPRIDDLVDSFASNYNSN